MSNKMKGAEEIIKEMIESNTEWIDLKLSLSDDEVKDIRDYILSNNCNGYLEGNCGYYFMIINYKDKMYNINYHKIRECKCITVKEIEVKRI